MTAFLSDGIGNGLSRRSEPTFIQPDESAPCVKRCFMRASAITQEGSP